MYMIKGKVAPPKCLFLSRGLQQSQKFHTLAIYVLNLIFESSSKFADNFYIVEHIVQET